MPRHPEGSRALTAAERQGRRRARVASVAAREKRFLIALMEIVYSPPNGEKARRIAWAAIKGTPQ